MAEQQKGWLHDWLAPIVYLSSNWISQLGVLLVTGAGISWLIVVLQSVGHENINPYLGLLTFFALPAAFFAGLFLIPLGIWLKRRRERRAGKYPAAFPVVSLANPRLVRLLAFIAITTVINLIIASHVTYEAIGYMDSVTFCGLTCHKVMEPEYAAYQNSQHSRVACVSCHIGPGASWFVKSKLSGAWQLVAVTIDKYERPIPTPVENLRPARDTCEGCHWPQKFGGTRLRVIPKFAGDAANSRTVSVLMMRIGGGHTRRGIHGAHLGPGIEIRYAHEDRERQKIPYVEVSHGGQKTEYAAAGFDPAKLGGMQTRTMDCMDCHNRPTHTFELPERAVDHILAGNDAFVSLPFFKKTAVELLRASYPSRTEALRQIPERLQTFYRTNHADVYAKSSGQVQHAAQLVRDVYSRNVFPQMDITWGTYTNNIGHTDFPGCFRCHDDEHKSQARGTKITQDCGTCHEMLAMEEPAPKILTDLGLMPATGATGGGL